RRCGLRGRMPGRCQGEDDEGGEDEAWGAHKTSSADREASRSGSKERSMNLREEVCPGPPKGASQKHREAKCPSPALVLACSVNDQSCHSFPGSGRMVR